MGLTKEEVEQYFIEEANFILDNKSYEEIVIRHLEIESGTKIKVNIVSTIIDSEHSLDITLTSEEVEGKLIYKVYLKEMKNVSKETEKFNFLIDKSVLSVIIPLALNVANR